MIEIIYKKENEISTDSDSKKCTVKVPKNVKQIGAVSDKLKIYLEDYVQTFLKQKPDDDREIRYGVLLGEINKDAGVSYIFIKGAVEVKDNYDNTIIFNDEVWTELYETIREYFDNQNIVGWYSTVQFENGCDMLSLQKTHLDNFAGEGKVCFRYDRTEDEESFYSYESCTSSENGGMHKQEGYYIYYEKNDNMQEYILRHNVGDVMAAEKNSVRGGSFKKIMNIFDGNNSENDDKVENKIDSDKENIKLTESDKNTEKQDEGKNYSLLRPAVSLLIVGLMVGAVALMNNYGSIDGVTNKIQSLAKNILGKEDAADNAIDAIEKNSDIVVDVINGGVNATTEDSTNNTTGESTTNPDETTTVAEKETTTLASEKETTTQQESATVAITPVDPQYHIVEKGESIYDISRKYYGSIKKVNDIIKANNLEDGNVIYEGQKLILP